MLSLNENTRTDILRLQRISLVSPPLENGFVEYMCNMPCSPPFSHYPRARPLPYNVVQETIRFWFAINAHFSVLNVKSHSSRDTNVLTSTSTPQFTPTVHGIQASHSSAMAPHTSASFFADAPTPIGEPPSALPPPRPRPPRLPRPRRRGRATRATRARAEAQPPPVACSAWHRKRLVSNAHPTQCTPSVWVA